MRGFVQGRTSGGFQYGIMSPAASIASLQRQPWRVGSVLALLLLALAQAAGVWRLPQLERWDAELADMRLALTMPHTLDSRVVIIDIDEASLQSQGRWPWSRARLAALVRELTERQQVAALGLDAVLAEPERVAAGQPSSALAPDDALARAIDGRPVALGYYFTSDRDGRRSGQLPVPLAGQAPWPQLLHWSGYGANLPALATVAPAAGFFNAVTDSDGVVRRVPLVAGFDGALYESMALSMLRLGLHPAPLRIRPVEPQAEGDRALTLATPNGPLALMMSAQGTVQVPFRGAGGPHGGSFRYVSAAAVLAGQLPPASLRGRYALLGFTAPGLMDLRTTPVGEAYPGVEVHANLISGVLDGRLRHRPNWAAAYELGLLLALGTLFVALLPRLGLLGVLGLGGAATAALLGLDAGLYLGGHWLLPLAGPLTFVAAALVLDLALGYGVERRARHRLAQQFASYVPPELVRQMQRDPQRYDMQARTEELTVMFCDLRGFTTLAETQSPAAMQALLREVLQRLTEVIARHHGTIDKYMGDCVMAFWGAPVRSEQHARQAVDAALEIRAALHALNTERARDGRAPLAVGIGLNTGPMAVGNMGTALRRTYTVIGDAVNLASRLEGLAATYGVDIVASQTTMQQAGVAEFSWQELDRVSVRGRRQADQIFTVRALAADADAALQRELQQWEQVLTLWRGGHFEACQAQAQALARQHPRMPVYALYAQRCAQLLHASS